MMMEVLAFEGDYTYLFPHPTALRPLISPRNMCKLRRHT
jgi:hypothetical protein